MTHPATPVARGEFVPNLVRFVGLLRGAGLAVSTEQTMSWLRATEIVSVASRTALFHTSRALLVNRREDLPVFALLFHRVFGPVDDAPHSSSRATRPMPRRVTGSGWTLASYVSSRATSVDPDVDVVDRAETYSAAEILQQKEFSNMTEDELEAVRHLIGEFRWQVARRRTRRWVLDPRGERPALRQALRQAPRFNGVPPILPRRRPREKPRPIVLLADISGSMERYARLILQFFHVLFRAERDIEAFVFGTRLTRITSEIRLRNVDRALDAAGRHVLDWAGGTRIGDCLQRFNREWSRRVLRRGAVVIIVSDGWDRGDPGQLRRAMASLQRRTHRLIWLNPHVARPGYEPRVEGMAAALPFVDDFLPVGNLQHLQDLADRLRSVPRRRNARRTGAVRVGSDVVRG